MNLNSWTSPRPSIPDDIPPQCPQWYIRPMKECRKQDKESRPAFPYVMETITQEDSDSENVVNIVLGLQQGSAMEEIGTPERLSNGLEVKAR